MKKLFVVSLVLGGLFYFQPVYAYVFCPCPTDTNGSDFVVNGSLCSYNSNDVANFPDQTSSDYCFSQSQFFSRNYQSCGVDSTTGLAKFCPAPAQSPTTPTFYSSPTLASSVFCPCPSSNDGTLCSYAPNQLSSFPSKTSGSQCLSLSIFLASRYQSCGVDPIGLNKYCPTSIEADAFATPTNYSSPTSSNFVFCPCPSGGDGAICSYNSNQIAAFPGQTSGSQCLSLSAFLAKGYQNCGLDSNGLSKFCPITASTVSDPPTASSSSSTGVFGTTCTTGTQLTVKALINCFVKEIINPLVYVIIGLAVVSFLAGLLKYVRNSDKAPDRQKGREFMMWGIIALTVMVSVWGIVNIVVGTFFGGGGLPTAPVLPTVRF